jgi:membrane-bound serine protease (ClpP class)
MKTMLRIVSLFLLLLLTPLAHAENRVVLLDVNGAISPATQDYVQHGIAYANAKKATVIILQLDTPGGLEISMRGIVKAILASNVPVVTYVAPEGARAASAGTMILYASQIAAMAPGTNVGAASPVNITGEKTPTVLEKKMQNDMAAFIRSLADMNARNSDWAEKAVRDAASLSAPEALKLHVIDIVADNMDDLLHAIDGRAVKMHGTTEMIETSHATIVKRAPSWRYQFLSVITEPNIAYILMLIGIYGLFFEFCNPGFVLPGVAGVISLLMALYAFQLLPINYVGFTLILLGIAFMVMELVLTTFGVLAVGGIIAFAIGSVMLFDSHVPGYAIAWQLILGMSLVSAAFFLSVIGLGIRAMRKKVITGKDTLIGLIGEVLEFDGKQGQVKVKGEIWQARCVNSLKPGQRVRVIAVTGLLLVVEVIEE